MADLKPISQFATASSVEANTLLFVSTPNQNNGYDSEKVSASELGEALVNDFMYTQDLPTVDKTITGSISEQNSVIGYSYDIYNPLTSYSVGDLCIYNNTLYKAKQATTGNLPTNTTYWEQTSIADEIGRIDTALSGNDITSEVTLNSDISLIQGQIYRIGSLITINAVLKANQSIPNNASIWTGLPRAKGNYRFAKGTADGVYYATDFTSGGLFIDNNSNSIGNFTAITANKYIYVNFSYITSE